MAQQRKRTNQTTPAPTRRRRRPPAKKKPAFRLPEFRRKAPDFKPDAEGSGWLKVLHLTRQQRMTYLKWLLLVAVIIVLLVIQDVVMSRVSLFGGTTDLAVCAILLITVMEGTETGSLFVLIASTFYCLSGSQPGPYSLMIITFTGIGACMFRQMFWHRSRGSIVLCAGLAQMVYETAIFGVALFMGLTRWDRIGVFAVTGLLSWAVMIPLYSLINAIGQIGGNTWKE